MKQTDILISGGGASGLAAAIAIKRISPECNVCICEKNSRIGKKYWLLEMVAVIWETQINALIHIVTRSLYCCLKL